MSANNPSRLLAASQPGEYQYTTLKHVDEIRILRLEPDASNEPLRGDLFHVRLSDKPQYMALSYVWGEPSLSKEIRCLTGYVRIAENLRDALMRIRHSVHQRKVWVDGICINQKDIQEKSAQISLMRQIYSHASVVSIWLGLETPDTDIAIRTIQNLARLYKTNLLRENAKNAYWKLPESQRPPLNAYAKGDNGGVVQLSEAINWDGMGLRYNADPWAQSQGIFPKNSPGWRCVEDLFNRPWFHRLWIIQEIAFAAAPVMTVGGGGSDLGCDWYTLVEAARCAAFSFRVGEEPIMNVPLNIFTLANIQARVRVLDKRVHISEMFSLTGKFLTSEPRDRVYALLGLDQTLAHDHEWLRPDYSLPVSDVYTRAAKYMLASGYMNILAMVEHPKNYADLPSWVPDWTVEFNANTFRQPTNWSWYKASNGEQGTPPQLLSHNSGRESDWLLLGGKTIDFVVATFDVVPWLRKGMPDTDATMQSTKRTAADLSWTTGEPSYPPVVFEYGKVLRIWRKWHKNIQLEMPYPSGCTRAEAFCRTVSAGFPKTTDGIAPPGFAEVHDGVFQALTMLEDEELSLTTLEDFGTKVKLLQAQRPLSLAHDAVAYEEATSRYFGAMSNATQGHRLVLTRKGYMGLAPKECRPNDRIVLFGGLDVPLILRDGEGMYDEARNGRPPLLWATTHQVIGSCFIDGIMSGEAWRDRTIPLMANMIIK